MLTIRGPRRLHGLTSRSFLRHLGAGATVAALGVAPAPPAASSSGPATADGPEAHRRRAEARAQPDDVLSTIGGRLAYVPQDGRIWVATADAPPARVTGAGDRRERSPRWSPDGRQLAFIGTVLESANPPRFGGDDVYVVTPGSDDARRLTFRNVRMYALEWSPDGTTLLYGTLTPDPSGTGERFDVGAVGADGAPVPAIVEGGEYLGRIGPTWSPDGSLIAFKRTEGSWEDGRSAVLAVSPSTGAVRVLADGISHPSRPVVGPVWTPDSSAVAYAVGPAVSEAAADGSGPRALFGAVGDVLSPTLAYAPDGAALAFATQTRPSGTTSLLVIRRDGTPTRELADLGPLQGGRLQWTADGRHILYVTTHEEGVAPKAYLWLVALDGASPRRFRAELSTVGGFDWRP